MTVVSGASVRSGLGSGGNPMGLGGGSSTMMNRMMQTTTASVVAATSAVVVDPGSLLNQRLAAALSTMGDAQYWEESIAPSQIRSDLDRVCGDPVNTSHTNIQTQLKCMKWLLANISKGRDVSDFYPSVIKLVGAISLEVRKMVYMFTVQYANHNSETRETSLLSINAFQRGLVDPEPLIRGLALRVLTSLQIPDVLQIQLLAVQTCTSDTSPYVRKCAANAVAKLAPRTRIANDLDPLSSTGSDETRALLMDILQNLLDNDSSTMVLTSALTSFAELTISNQWNNTSAARKANAAESRKDWNGDHDDSRSTSQSDGSSHYKINNRSQYAKQAEHQRNSKHDKDTDNDPLQLYRLHSSFRKICHLLTDMDEWGQVVVLDLLTRYCRQFFAEPVQQYEGTAERIDKQRRVQRPTIRIVSAASATNGSARGCSTAIVTTIKSTAITKHTKTLPSIGSPSSTTLNTTVTALPSRENTADGTIIGRKVRRRVIKKGFYSDEEDESTEEEVIVTTSAVTAATIKTTSSTTTTTAAAALTNSNSTTLTLPRNRFHASMPSTNSSDDTTNMNTVLSDADEDMELAPDHRLLLQAARPLLKSRNAGVVLAVCSLHYYCGVASVSIRASMGKALVRIVHTSKQQDNRRDEIQFVVLNAIRQLVKQCPSAFAPYMHDFFINPCQDPHFTRLIKLDILISLALEPPAITAVLNELRTYVQLLPTIIGDDCDNNNIGPSHNNYDDGDGDNDEYDALGPTSAGDLDDDIHFACMSIRAVGRVVEMTRIVFERHASMMMATSAVTSSSSTRQHHRHSNDHAGKSMLETDRLEADRIALNCLYGLTTLTEAAATIPPIVTGEAIRVMQQILRLLHSDRVQVVVDSADRSDYSNSTSNGFDNGMMIVQDPNRIQEHAIRRIMLFLIHTLNALYNNKKPDESKDDKDVDNEDNEDDEDDDTERDPMLQQLDELCGSTVLPATATCAAIAAVGDVLASFITPTASTTTTGDLVNNNYQAAFGNMFSTSPSTTRSQYRLEIARLLSRAFLALTCREKEQAIHFASRVIVSNKIEMSSLTFSGSGNSQSNAPQLDEVKICERILSMGRVDVNPIVRDRARFESNVLHLSIGLRFDTDAMDVIPSNLKANLASKMTDMDMINGAIINSNSTNDLIPDLDLSTGTTATNTEPLPLKLSTKIKVTLTLDDAKRIFLRTKPASSSLPLTLDNIVSASRSVGTGTDDDMRGAFRFGTLSSLVGHRARSSYVPLPPWAKKNSPDSIRDPPQEVNVNARKANVGGLTKAPTSSSKNKKKSKNPNHTKSVQSPEGFYNASDADDDDDSDGDDSTSSSSTSSSSSSQSNDADDDSSSSSSGSSSSDSSSVDSSHSEDREDKNRSGSQKNVVAKAGGLKLIHDTHTPPPTAKLQMESSSSTNEEDSESSSDSSSSSSNDCTTKNVTPRSVGNLIPIGSGTSGAPPSSTSYAANDLQGLVWNQGSATDTSSSVTTTTSSAKQGEYGNWFPLVRPEHSNGLLVEARYVRGVVKVENIKRMIMGFNGDKATVICLQLKFENTNIGNQSTSTATSILRRIRILQRSSGAGAGGRSSSSSSSSASTVGARKIVIVPQEIGSLVPGQKNEETYLGIDFMSVSDREGSLLAKLELKVGSSGSGSIPFDIRPSLAELLLPCQRSILEFDRAVHRMQGFQRLESTFPVPEGFESDSNDTVLARIMASAALTPITVGISESKNDETYKIRLAGTLPASMAPVYVVVQYYDINSNNKDRSQQQYQSGKIIVCCDNALVTNTIMTVVKKAATASILQSS